MFIKKCSQIRKTELEVDEFQRKGKSQESCATIYWKLGGTFMENSYSYGRNIMIHLLYLYLKKKKKKRLLESNLCMLLNSYILTPKTCQVIRGKNVNDLMWICE